MKTKFFILLFLCLIGTLQAQVRVVESGDVGVKTDTPEHELDVQGITRTSKYFEGTYLNKGEVTNTFQRILFPEGASLYSDAIGGSGGGDGAVKISLPVDWSNTMIKFTVEIFSYRYNKSFSLNIAGYPYAGSGGYWTETSASMDGGPEHEQIPVRFAHDGNKPCVIIGETDTDWAYLNVTISDLYVRLYYNGPVTDWTKGWNMSMITSLPSNIDQQHFVSNAYQSLYAMDGQQKQTAKFFFHPGNININTTETLGKIHLPVYYTFSFKVTVSSSMGVISYLFTGYGGVITKNIIEAMPRGANAPIDEYVDVNIQYDENPYEATIQVINNDPNYALYETNVMVESFSRLAPPYFTSLDGNTPITVHNYASVQNSVIGKWENTDNSVVNTLDRTISRTGDVFIDNVAKGVVIRDQTNSNCYRIVSNNGVLSTQQVACPQ